MNDLQTNILICGAGIAGVSAAYHLAVRQGVQGITLLDERPPLTLTSDKSTEAYRNWWPGPDSAMVEMINRSIDLIEMLARESRNIFNLNQRGYLFATAEAGRIAGWQAAARQAESYGAGPLRLHTGSPGEAPYTPAEPHGFGQPLSGADLITAPGLLRQHFPYLPPETAAVLHVRRAGWLSAQQLGMYMLEQAQKAGVTLLRGKMTGVEVTEQRVQAVKLADGRRIATRTFVAAAGPLLGEIGGMLGIDLPIINERHLKVSFQDRLTAVPRHAPMLIWSDEQKLTWPEEEREFIAEDPETAWLLDTFPSGAHTRPDGEGDSQVIILLWEYHTPVCEPEYPLELDPFYPEIALRGMTAMLPALTPYLERIPQPYLDGGYYTKTEENRPLACPLPVEGAYVIGALSGFGIMSALGLGEVLAAHITGSPLPPYAPAFDLRRYKDPAYQAKLAAWGDSWQL